MTVLPGYYDLAAHECVIGAMPADYINPDVIYPEQVSLFDSDVPTPEDLQKKRAEISEKWKNFCNQEANQTKRAAAMGLAFASMAKGSAANNETREALDSVVKQQRTKLNFNEADFMERCLEGHAASIILLLEPPST